MTFRMYHNMNVSRQEANSAIVRVMLPNPVEFVSATDTQLCNITSNFTNNRYLDFTVSYYQYFVLLLRAHLYNFC